MKNRSIVLILVAVLLDYHQVRAFAPGINNGIGNRFHPVFPHSSAIRTSTDKEGLSEMGLKLNCQFDVNRSRCGNSFRRDLSQCHSHSHSHSHSLSSTIINMMIDSSILYSTSQVITTASEQSIEAEIFGDLAHLCLDFATVFSPDTVVLRLFVVCGRIFAILSDYIPDGQMTPDEVLVQFALLGLGCRNFFSKFSQILASSTKTSSFRDRRVYHCIFRPAGFSWTQYLALMNDAIEWIDVPDGSYFLEHPENLLIVSRGILCMKHTSRNGYGAKGEQGANDLYQQTETLLGKRNGRSSLDVVGDLSSLSQLTGTKRKRSRSSSSLSFRSSPSSSLSSFLSSRTSAKLPHGDNINDTHTGTINDMDADLRREKIQVFRALGGCGASLLRIDTERLFEMARKDNYLAECTKNLFFNTAQDRLRYYEPEPNIGIKSSTDPPPLPSSGSTRTSKSASSSGFGQTSGSSITTGPSSRLPASSSVESNSARPKRAPLIHGSYSDSNMHNGTHNETIIPHEYILRI